MTRRTDTAGSAQLQALQGVAGAVAGAFGSACNLKSQARQGLGAVLQALQAQRAHVRTCVGACRRAGAQAGGRARTLTRARNHTPATPKKSCGGNHLRLAATAGSACNGACNPCHACNPGERPW